MLKKHNKARPTAPKSQDGHCRGERGSEFRECFPGGLTAEMESDFSVEYHEPGVAISLLLKDSRVREQGGHRLTLFPTNTVQLYLSTKN